MNPGFGEIISSSVRSRRLVSPEGTGGAAERLISVWIWSLGSGGRSSEAVNCAFKLRNCASKGRSWRSTTGSFERHHRRTPVAVPAQLALELGRGHPGREQGSEKFVLGHVPLFLKTLRVMHFPAKSLASFARLHRRGRLCLRGSCEP
jgi:hypothetical protein